MSDLLPCPFCGATAYVRQRSHSMPRPQTYQIQCGECYCGTSDRYETEAYAVAAWNKRKSSQRVADLTRALEAMRDVSDEIIGWSEAGRQLVILTKNGSLGKRLQNSIEQMRALASSDSK